MDLEGKHVVLGVTGSIAAYKACELVRLLKKAGAGVTVLMTAAAEEFVGPITFQTLSREPVVTDLFEDDEDWDPEHIALADRADIFCVAPATANTIARLSLGLADDPITTTALVVRCPCIVAPAMNDRMWSHQTVGDHMKVLADRGWHVVEPAEGELACGTHGVGKLADVERIFAKIRELAGRPD